MKPKRRELWEALHNADVHDFCVEERIVDHYDYGKQWMVGKKTTDPETGIEYTDAIDVTTFGGTPVYGNKTRHVMRR